MGDDEQLKHQKLIESLAHFNLRIHGPDNLGQLKQKADLAAVIEGRESDPRAVAENLDQLVDASRKILKKEPDALKPSTEYPDQF